jgi:hypothetical protein
MDLAFVYQVLMKGMVMNRAIRCRHICFALILIPWTFATRFAKSNEYQTPNSIESSLSQIGLSSSMSYYPCPGCASSEGYKLMFSGDLSYNFRMHQIGTLRLRATVMAGPTLGVSEEAHTDCPDGAFLSFDAEYMLSSKGGWVAWIAGVSSAFALHWRIGCVR